jgi:hypothetical protein
MSMIENRKANITDAALSFAPFGILLGGAIIASTFAPDVLYARTQWTFRVSMLLAAPALAILIFSFGREPLPKLWRLWWTFAFLAMAVHVAFAFFGMQGGDISTVPLTMGQTGAILLGAVLALWTLDVLFAWIAPRALWLPVRLIRLLAGIGVFTATLYATFNRTGVIYWLGIALIVIAAGAFVLRLFTTIRRSPA